MLCGARGWFRPWFIGWRGENAGSRGTSISWNRLRLDPTSDWAKTGAADTSDGLLDGYRSIHFGVDGRGGRLSCLAGVQPRRAVRTGFGCVSCYAISVFLILAGGLTAVLSRSPVNAAVVTLHPPGVRGVLSPVRRRACKELQSAVWPWPPPPASLGCSPRLQRPRPCCSFVLP